MYITLLAGIVIKEEQYKQIDNKINTIVKKYKDRV